MCFLPITRIDASVGKIITKALTLILNLKKMKFGMGKTIPIKDFVILL